ncbi:MAG: alpha/beta hydrolase family protein [Pirellulales bacterium]
MSETRRTMLMALGAMPWLSSVLSAGDAPRELPATAADLGTSFDVVRQIAAWNAPRSLEPFDAAMRSAVKREVLGLLQYEPPATPLSPKTVEKVDCGDYVRERFEISTTPWFRPAGYLLVPKRRTGRAPAIVDLHSHGGMFLFGKEKVIDLGDNHPAMTQYHQRNYGGRPTATELVRRGYVVAVIDAFGFGERRILLDEDRRFGWDRSQYSLDDVQQLNAKCRGKESTIAKSLVLAGTTWLGIVNYDDRRVIDYLQSRDEVDPDRIGCIGISMGGYRSAYLAALDQRIKAACVVGFMSTMTSMLQAHVDTHSWIHFLPGLHRGLDFPDVASLAAPRSLFVQQCRQDRLFPLQGMRDSLERLATRYAQAGAAGKFRGAFYDEPHHWTTAMQDEAFEWLDQQLKS